MDSSTDLLLSRLPRPMVFTNGVFDLLHAGHVQHLALARRQGASLVVAVNDDASARRLGKGPGRPFQGARERLTVVSALSSVSVAVLFDEDTPVRWLRTLRPEVYVKGGDYRLERLPEARVVAEWGGRTLLLPLHGGHSTTALIYRIQCAAEILQ